MRPAGVEGESGGVVPFLILISCPPSVNPASPPASEFGGSYLVSQSQSPIAENPFLPGTSGKCASLARNGKNLSPAALVSPEMALTVPFRPLLSPATFG